MRHTIVWAAFFGIPAYMLLWLTGADTVDYVGISLSIGFVAFAEMIATFLIRRGHR